MPRSAERTEFLSDILTTAVEAGWPWFQVIQYQYVYDGEVCVYAGQRHGDETHATMREMNDEEDGYKATDLDLDLDAIARGLRLYIAHLTRPEGTERGREYARILREAEREYDAGGEIDASAADTIVQYALLGEERYA